MQKTFLFLLISSYAFALPGLPKRVKSGKHTSPKTCVNLSGSWKGPCAGTEATPEIAFTLRQTECAEISFINEEVQVSNSYSLDSVESRSIGRKGGDPYSHVSSFTWDPKGETLSFVIVSMFPNQAVTEIVNVSGQLYLTGNKLHYEVAQADMSGASALKCELSKQ